MAQAKDCSVRLSSFSSTHDFIIEKKKKIWFCNPKNYLEVGKQYIYLFTNVCLIFDIIIWQSFVVVEQEHDYSLIERHGKFFSSLNKHTNLDLGEIDHVEREKQSRE